MRIGVSWLDVKLGLRMLARYPGLSIAGGLGIALVIVCGAVAGIFHAVINGTLPFEDGERIVAIENWDTSAHQPAPHDFLSWRSALKTVEHVGAYRLVRRNIGAAHLTGEPVRLAEISAAAFTVARVPPHLGRYLTADDERENAPAVVVVGYDEWQRRFAGDAQIIGRTITVGDTPSSVVGVMPKGFGFPVNERYWIPLRQQAIESAGRRAPSSMPFKEMPHGVLHVFGRLADGAELAHAQSELAVIGQRAANDSPDTHARVRPRVLPYTRWFFDEQHDGEIFLVQGMILLILGIVGANVAVLVYARTASRRIEIALRSALGASRGRIVGQMFAEGLVLSTAAAAAGLLVAVVVRAELDALITWEQAPFWVNTGVMSGTVLTYVLALAFLGAVVVGAIPALQATGRRAQSGLQHAAASSSGWRIGRTYAVLIAAQVALAVAVLPYAVSSSWTSIREAMADPGFPAGEFLTAHVDLDSPKPRGAAMRQAALARRLESEAAVSDVILLTSVPGSERRGRVQIEGTESVREVGIGRVSPEFVETFDIRLLAGRTLEPRDTAPAGRRVVVNRTFAEQIAGGQPLGRRIRDAGLEGTGAGPWLEIVGVVEDFPARATVRTAADAKIYEAVVPGVERFAILAVRVRGTTPLEFAARLRDIATTLDPGLQLREMRSMDALLREQQMGARIGAWASALVTLSLLLLSATGLYALMSFAVTQRRRETAIRVALGASPGRLLSALFSRALWQLAAGIAIGLLVAGILHFETGGDSAGGASLAVLPAVAAFVLLVGLLSVAGPARRGLRTQASDALKEA